LKNGTKKIEIKLSNAARDGRYLRKTDVSETELRDLLADIDADYADRTGGVSQALWEWTHENFKAEIACQRKAHFAQQTRTAKEREQVDTSTVALNLAGKAWAPVVKEWLEARAFVIDERTLFPLDLDFWQQDFAKIVAEANQQHLPLDNAENITAIVRNQAQAGEIHMRDLVTGESITGLTLVHYDLLVELLKPTSQRRDMRTADEFLRTDPAIRAEEKRINDELMAARRAEEVGKFLATEPSYAPSETNRKAILSYLEEHDLMFTAENVRRAFHELFAVGKVSRIPNVEIQTGNTNARIWPPTEKDNSDEARDFRALVQKLTAEQYDERLASDSEFRQKAEQYL